jgi:hypothetical protein
MSVNSIKFAGLLNAWDFAAAKVYSNKLHEMGFFAKVIKIGEVFGVAYCHRTFTQIECHATFESMFQNVEGESEKDVAW